MKYPIYEHFHAFQGEGFHMGRPAYFFRLYGCPLKCSWCDSAGTWHKDWKPDHVGKINEEEMLQTTKSKKFNFIVITGGEPAIFNLNPIVDIFHENDIKIHIETSGAFPIKGDFDWITVSPKMSQKPLVENIEKANELKIIVDSLDSIDEWEKHFKNKEHIWLHPEWSQRSNPEILDLISCYVKSGRYNCRAGYQLHKLYNIDRLDPNSKSLTPLGGNINNGY